MSDDVIGVCCCDRRWLWNGHHICDRLRLLQRHHCVDPLLFRQVIRLGTSVESLQKSMEHGALLYPMERKRQSLGQRDCCLDGSNNGTWSDNIGIERIQRKGPHVQRRVLGVRITTLDFYVF